MADTGARPAEAIAVEHRHVSGPTVELPGRKTTLAWRTVHMTSRGRAAVDAVPRALATRCVFHIDGRPISWVYFRREVWAPALEAAGLEQRPPYNLRHTFAYWSLRAGVPIASLAREMGHESTEHSFRVYGDWCLEVGADAAVMRSGGRRQAPQRRPMSSALIGFIGVIAGVLASGGIEWFLGSRERKQDARVAAAILFADLAIAYQALQPLLVGNPPNAVQLDRYLERWKEEQRALAGGVSPSEFQLITVAFRNLDEYVVQGVTVPDKLHALKLVETLERGMKLAWLASGMKNLGEGANAALDAAETGSQSE